MSVCPRCQSQVLPNSHYCDLCGCHLEAPAPEPQVTLANFTTSTPATAPPPASVAAPPPAPEVKPSDSKPLQLPKAPLLGAAPQLAPLPQTPSQILGELPNADKEEAPQQKARWKEWANTLIFILSGLGLAALALYLLLRHLALLSLSRVEALF